MKSFLSILALALCTTSNAQNPQDLKEQMRSAIQSNNVESARLLCLEGIHPRDTIDIDTYGGKVTLTFWRLAREVEQAEIVELFNIYESTGVVPSELPRPPEPRPLLPEFEQPVYGQQPKRLCTFDEWGCDN